MKLITLGDEINGLKKIESIISNVDELSYQPPVFTNAEIPPMDKKFGKTPYLAYDELNDKIVVLYKDRELTEEEKTSKSRDFVMKFIRVDELTLEELNSLMKIYPKWESGLYVVAGDLYRYNGKLYEVIQAHTTQSDCIPDITPALWKSKMPEGVIGEWVKPTGGHDAYMLGDKMLYTDGLVYESTRDDNVWSPVELPSGWKVVN